MLKNIKNRHRHINTSNWYLYPKPRRILHTKFISIRDNNQRFGKWISHFLCNRIYLLIELTSGTNRNFVTKLVMADITRKSRTLQLKFTFIFILHIETKRTIVFYSEKNPSSLRVYIGSSICVQCLNCVSIRTWLQFNAYEYVVELPLYHIEFVTLFRDSL